MIKKCIIAPIHYFYPAHRDPLPKSLSLEGGYVLKEFNQSVLEKVFAFFNESFSEQEKRELRNCRYAIYHYYNIDNDNSEIPEEKYNDINRIILTLRIVKRTRSIPTVLHFKIGGNQKEILQVSHKPLINITFPPDTTPSREHFDRLDGYKIRKYWKFVRSLYTNFGGTYHKVLNALFFFELGHQNHLYKPRMVNFVTSLESLFNVSTEQIGFLLRTRCAHFLEKNPQARIDLSENLKEIYNLRSTFVHGQGLTQRVLNDQIRLNHLLSDSEEVTRRCLQKIFDNNLVDLFGDLDNLKVEFQKLDLGLHNLLTA